MMKTRIKYKMLAPVSHIGETASTGSYFQTILTSSGRVPVITGNSIRGRIRDSVALNLLELLDAKVDKEVFNILFSGGNLNGTMKDDIGKAKAVREHFPSISLLGGGLGDMIMSGKMIASFAYPVCRETSEITGIESDISWHNLIDEIEFTRTDDGKNDQKADFIEEEISLIAPTPKASTQMRFSVQYMAAGTEFVQDFHFLNANELEIGAFYSGLKRWFANPTLGGMSAKGFGLFSADVGDGDMRVGANGEVVVSDTVSSLIEKYESFVVSEGDTYFDILKSKAVKKNGKKADSST